jgi:molecular chaperone GrpE
LSEAGKTPNPPEAANDEGMAPKDEMMSASPEHADSVPDPKAVAIALAERVSELEVEITNLKDERLRALAEADNARRRAQKDREEANRYGATGLARDVVSVADNIARALAAMPDAGGDEAVAKLAEGVSMVEKELSQALEKHHIKTIGEVGAAFDHNTCQAVFEVETGEAPAGTIAQVLQKGYLLHDRLLRPAMVGVAKAPVGAAPPAEAGDRGGQIDETA